MPGVPQISSVASKNKDAGYAFSNALTGNGTVAFHSNGASVTANGFWSRHSDNVSYDRLQKFWCELTIQSRRNLLKIDKHTIFEHARKNMYCSRCNGLLLEGFFQIVMYGKSQQPNPASGPYNPGSTENHTIHDLFGPYNCQDDVQDPSVHPWGGLTTTRDGMITLLDCYFHSKSLRDLQNLFDSARARERERELLYPDACGGGARGWISQGSGGYGRGHGTRESCALHTAKLSVETLVDFWSALSEETHHSLLRMKEEDFIERLMYRFDSKRFCRDCRKNVIREFKELKELERARRETRCTSWFCVADTVFDYEVSQDTIKVDWHQAFSDAFGKYHHFEWAVGTGEGKSDILEFENVGLKRSVQANGLDLSGFNSCHITVRAWKVDGRCDELCAKAHALQGQQCVHCRLTVGGGIVSITRGESITRLFEHAEDAEEEEDDDFMDKEGNELDSECFRPQKHAKSPELAREFLLDAATIIFKEQVEKAFREGTARQNAHSILICLVLKLLEERAHIACKEIITFEKQMKLLEEEEKEKREKEERKEQRRTKEREKKLRRKERLRGRDNREKKAAVFDLNSVEPDDLKDESKECLDDTADAATGDLSHETGEVTPSSPSLNNEAADYNVANAENTPEDNVEQENGNLRGWPESLRAKQNISRSSSQDLYVKSTYRRKDGSSETKVFFTKFESSYHIDDAEPARSSNGLNKQARGIAPKPYTRISGKNEKFQHTNRSGTRYDSQSCCCKNLREFRPRADHTARLGHDPKCPNRYDTQSDMSKPYYRGNKHSLEFRHENTAPVKNKVLAGNAFNGKKVWEPLESRKKYTGSHSDSDVTLRSAPNVEASESSSTSSDDIGDITVRTSHPDDEMKQLTGPRSDNCTNVGVVSCSMTGTVHGASSDMSIGGSSNSDNCSSCLSEGDSSTLSSPQNMEPESTSDSEDSGQNLETRASECGNENGSNVSGIRLEEQATSMVQDLERQVPSNLICDPLDKSTTQFLKGREDTRVMNQTPTVLPHVQKHRVDLPVFHPLQMDYYHQAPGSWSSYPSNGLQAFPISNPYMFPPNTYGYGLNGNPQFMVYRPLQPLTPAVFNHPRVPVFQPVPSQVSEATPFAHKATPNNSHPAVPRPVADAAQNGKQRTEVESNGFSLFHFGGPVPLSSSGTNADPASQTAEGQGGNSSAEPVADFHSCSEEDAQKQQKVFDGNNGIRFSIF